MSFTILSVVASTAPHTSWVSSVLDAIADQAVEHPFLIGTLLILILISTSLHVVAVGARLFLEMLRYFRRQTAELQDLGHLYREEFASWRQLLDIAKVRSMTSAEVTAELARKEVDVQRTTEVVNAFVDVLLIRLRDEDGSEKAAHPPETKED